MQVLVDADACPVKELIVREARRFGISVIMLTDTSHELGDGYSRILTVDKGKDSVDIMLANLVRPGDIVVTQDYGVAAMALGYGAKALNQNGLVFTEENIDRLLFERYLSQRLRRAGGKAGKVRKRSKSDDEEFVRSLLVLLDGGNN